VTAGSSSGRSVERYIIEHSDLENFTFAIDSDKAVVKAKKLG
jgi:hypothetical protein